MKDGFTGVTALRQLVLQAVNVSGAGGADL